MTSKACTPDNALGAFMGAGDSAGMSAADDAVEMLDNAGQAVYHNKRSKGQSELLKAGNPDLSKQIDDLLDDTIIPITEQSRLNIRGGVTQGFKPTDFLPESVTKPVLDYVHEFTLKNGDNLGAVRGEFVRGVRGVIDGINLNDLHPSIKGEAKQWFADLKQGYPLYNKSGNWLTTGVSNVVTNAVDFSGNIIFGNPFEAMIKLPTVYGFSGTWKGIHKYLKATNGNLWGKVPELESLGYYGFPGAKKGLYAKAADGVMALTDRPLKGLAWGAGGVEGVEKVAFVNRLGNDSRMGRNPLGRGMLTFTNYTLNTYHLLGSNMTMLLNPKATGAQRTNAARALGTYTALTGIIGGPAAIIPEPVSWLLKKADPDYEEWEKEHISPVGKLIRPGSLTTLGISTQMATRAAQRAYGKLGSGVENLVQNEDVNGAIFDFADAGLSLMSFLRGPLGNPRMQKVLRNTRDLWEGEISEDEYFEKNVQTMMPFLKSED